jgi:hypothetical protein
MMSSERKNCRKRNKHFEPHDHELNSQIDTAPLTPLLMADLDRLELSLEQLTTHVPKGSWLDQFLERLKEARPPHQVSILYAARSLVLLPRSSRAKLADVNDLLRPEPQSRRHLGSSAATVRDRALGGIMEMIDGHLQEFTSRAVARA